MTNLYEEVEALAPGTIWNIAGGAPWLRTETGVLDLCRGITHTDTPIPEGWRFLNYSQPVNIIYSEDV